MPHITKTSTAPLTLHDEFPPVSTAAWEAAIAKDLKGADYDGKLVWKTDEGIAVKPYYRAGDAPRREPLVRPGGTWKMLAAGHEPALDASAVEFHEAGATAVQEVAFALAQAAELLATGAPVHTLGFAVGGNHFMEIAKLRAARLLFAQVASAFAEAGGDRATSVGCCENAVHVHARTAAANKTLFDPYVNLLRVTTEAMSAVIGGCDSLTIAPCRFDAHLADNLHRILRDESRLDAVMDPGAGSYYVEALTDAVAREAWSLFQEIEAGGGFTRYRDSGALDAALAGAREVKQQAIAARRRILVGTNHYPNVQERALGAGAELPAGWRLASVVEAIRLRTERHARTTGRTPRVLLLERGDLKMRKARSAFCLNFFGCAGFDVVASDTLQEADLLVLCSADAEYLSLAREIRAQVNVPVVVAGNPKDQIDALEAAGVAGFVHLRSDLVGTLTLWQNRLGIKD